MAVLAGVAAWWAVAGAWLWLLGPSAPWWAVAAVLAGWVAFPAVAPAAASRVTGRRRGTGADDPGRPGAAVDGRAAKETAA